VEGGKRLLGHAMTKLPAVLDNLHVPGLHVMAAATLLRYFAPQEPSIAEAELLDAERTAAEVFGVPDGGGGEGRGRPRHGPRDRGAGKRGALGAGHAGPGGDGASQPGRVDGKDPEPRRPGRGMVDSGGCTDDGQGGRYRPLAALQRNGHGA
jgi:hypothetical protein